MGRFSRLRDPGSRRVAIAEAVVTAIVLLPALGYLAVALWPPRKLHASMSSRVVTAGASDAWLDATGQSGAVLDGQGWIWTLALGGTPRRTISVPPDDAVFGDAPNGVMCIYRDSSHEVASADVGQGARRVRKTGIDWDAWSLSSDGRYAVVDSAGGPLRLVDLATRASYPLGGAAPAGSHTVPPPGPGTRVAVRQSETWVRVWDIGTGRLLLDKDTPRRADVPALSPDGSSIAVGMKEGGMIEWDVASGRCTLRTVPVPSLISEFFAPFYVRCVAYSTDGTQIALGTDGRVEVWDRRWKRNAAIADLGGAAPLAAAIDSRKHQLITVDSAGWVKVWPL